MALDILIQTTGACSVHIYDAHLAVAWVKALAGLIRPDDYLGLFKALHPMNPDALSNARFWVEQCFGAPA